MNVYTHMLITYIYVNLRKKNTEISLLNKLAYHYEEKEDFPTMEKYYLMAIDKDDTKAMYNLATYYAHKKDYQNMEKYYMMAIALGNANSMYNLAIYYNKIEDYPNMENII